MKSNLIDLSHGSGGKQTSDLIGQMFMEAYGNDILGRMEDAAVIDIDGPVAYTTDSFVVTPMFFPGGDIGKLAICGTVNDLAVMGAAPKYLTAGFILEAGASIEDLKKITETMGAMAQKAGIKIVAGDTKVVEGNGNIYINTSGIGAIQKRGISIHNCKEGDVILLSGNLGEHHAAILSKRMGIENDIQSDCAPLCHMTRALIDANLDIHCMRDVTRGGLATVLNEMADSSSCQVMIEEGKLPVSEKVDGLCQILGLDPLYMANEGKIIVVLPKNQAQEALDIVRQAEFGENAVVIGEIISGENVHMRTKLGGFRRIDVLYGEGLPRIC